MIKKWVKTSVSKYLFLQRDCCLKQTKTVSVAEIRSISMLLYYSKCCRITFGHVKSDNSNQMISGDFTLVIIIGKLAIEIKSHKAADRLD